MADLSSKEIRRRLAATYDYEASFYRIREDSPEAWDALERLKAAQSNLLKMLAEALKREAVNG